MTGNSNTYKYLRSEDPAAGKHDLKNSLQGNRTWGNRDINETCESEKDISGSRLYMEYYNLKKPPFTITPDPEFLYSSITHETAIEKILYGIEANMGFVLLTGEVGTGKTTLCRAVLDRLEGKAETVYIINPSLSGMEIIEAILDDLGVLYAKGASKKVLLDQLNRYLLKITVEKPVVIIIDDAQTMTPEGLENLRLLTNLETDKRKLVQLILAGQQELHDLLSRPELRQLKQRTAICCHLDLLDYTELHKYISMRLLIAGDSGRIKFSSGAVKSIYRASNGIPRLINIICDYALTAGYVSDSPVIKRTHAQRAIDELRYQSLIKRTPVSGIFSFISGKRNLLLLLVLFLGLPVSSPISNETTVMERAVSPGVHTSQDYIVQLASFKTLKDAMQEVSDLRKRGIDVHWNAVHMTEKGRWYRVYKRGFASEEEALQFKKENGFDEGIIIHTPWTVRVTSGDRVKTPEDVYPVMQENGHDCILEKDGDTGLRLISGAFKSYERALRAAGEILDLGFDARPEQL